MAPPWPSSWRMARGMPIMIFCVYVDRPGARVWCSPSPYARLVRSRQTFVFLALRRGQESHVRIFKEHERFHAVVVALYSSHWKGTGVYSHSVCERKTLQKIKKCMPFDKRCMKDISMMYTQESQCYNSLDGRQ